MKSFDEQIELVDISDIYIANPRKVMTPTY